MVSKSRERTQTKATKATRRKQTPQLNEEAEQILEKAQIYLLFEAKRPMFWNVASVREEKGEGGSRRRMRSATATGPPARRARTRACPDTPPDTWVLNSYTPIVKCSGLRD
jgi:hypothetical protein